jgi:transposase
MTQIRKHYSPAFQSQVVQEVLAGDKSLSQIAAHYGFHPNTISKWKRAALQAMLSAFDEESHVLKKLDLSHIPHPQGVSL